MNYTYPRKGEWRKPKPNSGRKCVVCGTAPAGIQFIQVSYFRGEDERCGVCERCKRFSAVEIVHYANKSKEEKSK